MAPHGYNIRVNVYRRVAQPDDAVGGAVMDEQLHLTDVRARIADARTTLESREMGLEVPQLYNGALWPSTLDIEENDLLVPQDGPYKGLTMKITHVSRSSFWPPSPRGQIVVDLQRVERARTVQ